MKNKLKVMLIAPLLLCILMVIYNVWKLKDDKKKYDIIAKEQSVQEVVKTQISDNYRLFLLMSKNPLLYAGDKINNESYLNQLVQNLKGFDYFMTLDKNGKIEGFSSVKENGEEFSLNFSRDFFKSSDWFNNLKKNNFTNDFSSGLVGLVLSEEIIDNHEGLRNGMYYAAPVYRENGSIDSYLVGFYNLSKLLANIGEKYSDGDYTVSAKIVNKNKNETVSLLNGTSLQLKISTLNVDKVKESVLQVSYFLLISLICALFIASTGNLNRDEIDYQKTKESLKLKYKKSYEEFVHAVNLMKNYEHKQKKLFEKSKEFISTFKDSVQSLQQEVDDVKQSTGNYKGISFETQKIIADSNVNISQFVKEFEKVDQLQKVINVELLNIKLFLEREEIDQRLRPFVENVEKYIEKAKLVDKSLNSAINDLKFNLDSNGLAHMTKIIDNDRSVEVLCAQLFEKMNNLKIQSDYLSNIIEDNLKEASVVVQMSEQLTAKITPKEENVEFIHKKVS